MRFRYYSNGKTALSICTAPHGRNQIVYLDEKPSLTYNGAYLFYYIGN